MTQERGLSADFLKSAICELTAVEHTSQGYEITLPQIYHNGVSVVVVVRPDGNGFTIHDNSYAAMLVAKEGVKLNRSALAALTVQIDAYGCSMDGLRVKFDCQTIEQVPIAATLVGSASRLVADYSLRVERANIFDFRSSLLSKVVSVVGAARVRSNEEVRGHLGSRYKVSAVILDRMQSLPIAFVEPIADRESVPRRFKEFYDLARTDRYANVERIAVYDDDNPIPSGDALLMQEVGNLVRFRDAQTRFELWG